MQRPALEEEQCDVGILEMLPALLTLMPLERPQQREFPLPAEQFSSLPSSIAQGTRTKIYLIYIQTGLKKGQRVQMGNQIIWKNISFSYSLSRTFLFKSLFLNLQSSMLNYKSVKTDRINQLVQKKNKPLCCSSGSCQRFRRRCATVRASRVSSVS